MSEKFAIKLKGKSAPNNTLLHLSMRELIKRRLIELHIKMSPY